MRKLWVAESFPMFFGRSGYGYRSYSFPNPLYLLPSLERDYKYILLYIYNLYIYYLQSVSPRKHFTPSRKIVTSVTVTTVTTTVSLLILSWEEQGIITFSQLLSENHIYTIALLNFSMNEDAFDKEKIRHHVQLCDTATVMEITGLSAEKILLLKREK